MHDINRQHEVSWFESYAPAIYSRRDQDRQEARAMREGNAAETECIVSGVKLPRPFRIRRLGHFGLNVHDPEVSRVFYERLLGFCIADPLDLSPRLPAEKMAQLGPETAYFMRHGTDHHAFVLFPRRVVDALAGRPSEHPEVTVNQITWQVGSLREVVAGVDWLSRRGLRIHRTGRDLPGSNWHLYPFDPDGHLNELYYGIEQIGWDGLSKPAAAHRVRYTAPPSLPHISEYAEVAAARAAGIALDSGTHQSEIGDERFDVGGVLLARPFKIVRIGPVRLFVPNIDKSLSFYRDELGLTITEEIVFNGHRCVFLRANTDHHSLALYPIGLRQELGLSPHSTLFSFGLQLGGYDQLRAALPFLAASGVQLRKLPPELFPGIDYSAFAIDPDGHAIQLYYYMEQIGWDGKPRPEALRPRIDNEHWPETVDGQRDTFLGEPYLGPWN